jgi:O-antigen ligase
MIGLLLVALVHEPKQLIRRWWDNKTWVALTCIFLLCLPSYFYSENTGYWLERVRLKLPFLALPLAFAGLPTLQRKDYYNVFYITMLFIFVCTVGVLVNYGFHYDAINEAMYRSQPIPTPIHHIRFSLMMALSICVGWVFYRQGYYWKFPWERLLIGFITIFLFIAIHILAVRSGLLALYLGIFSLLIHYIFTQKKYAIGGLLLVAFCLTPIVAYHTLESVRAKVELTKWNYMVYQSGKIEHYSDTRRWLSYQIAIEEGNKAPLFGVGLGDAKDVMDARYKEYPDTDPMLPHNEFLFMFLAMGWVGVILFTLLFFFPLFYKKSYKDALMLSFYAIAFSSLLTETTLQTSIGTAFFIYYLCLMVKLREFKTL